MSTKTDIYAMSGFRHFSSSEHTGYRFGFQGQERDDEVKGNGNSINYRFRIHDPRLGRFLSLDPIARNYPWNSPYAFSENRVIDGVEMEGLEYRSRVTVYDDDGNVAKVQYVTHKDLAEKTGLWGELRVYLNENGDNIRPTQYHRETIPTSVKRGGMSGLSEFVQIEGSEADYGRVFDNVLLAINIQGGGGEGAVAVDRYKSAMMEITINAESWDLLNLVSNIVNRDQKASPGPLGPGDLLGPALDDQKLLDESIGAKSAEPQYKCAYCKGLTIPESEKKSHGGPFTKVESTDEN